MMQSPFSPSSGTPGRRSRYNSEREVTALSIWLQTFPMFDLSLLVEGETGVSDRLFQVLDDLETVRAIWKVAQHVCEDDTMQSEDPEFNEPDKVWTSLMLLTSQRARPTPPSNEKLSPERLKIHVLSSLLDCAVSTKNLDHRRAFIERIMTLQKPTQKVLMGLIEQRGAKRSSSSNTSLRSGGSNSTSLTRSPSIRSANSSRSASGTPQRSTISPITPQRASRKTIPPSASTQPLSTSSSSSSFSLLTPPRTKSSGSGNSASIGSSGRATPTQTSTPLSSPRAKRTGIPSYNDGPATPVRSNTRSPSPPASLSPDPGNDKGFGETPSSAGEVPSAKQRLLPSDTPLTARNGEMGFLSPGTLESPGRLQNIVSSLHRRNQDLQGKVEAVTTAEEGLRSEIEDKDREHRQQAIKIETAALLREQELRDQLEEQEQYFEKEVRELRDQAEQGHQAQEQLRLAMDELELLEHNKHMLSETTEKMHKFREKVSELADVKDALAREQTQHSKAVDELVRLESEVKTLEVTKRQLDDYKIRAIEAEVKLVECQDYLRRVEQQNSEDSAEKARLYQGTVMQKEQMEEMISRIQQETQYSMDNSESSGGVGNGINELNMEVKQELAKLRNENLQLRAFAAKRQEDAVQALETQLEEANMVANKYKDDYRNTLDALADTQGMLEDIKQKEAQLRTEVDQWKTKSSKSEARVAALEESLQTTQEELESIRSDLTAKLARNEQLTREVMTWTGRAREAQTVAAERLKQIEGMSSDLEDSQAILEQAEQKIESLKNEADEWEARANKFEQELRSTEEDLSQSENTAKMTKQKLSESQDRVAQLENRIDQLQGSQANLERMLEAERHSKKKTTEEAEQAMVATRQVIEAKASKDLESMRDNMHQLLDEEREANRRKVDELTGLMESLDGEWNGKYEALESHCHEALKRAQDDSEKRLDSIQRKHKAEMKASQAQTQEAKESCDNIVRKGRAMLEEAKAKATADFQALKDELDSLQNDLDAVNAEKEQLEQSSSAKVATLNKKLTVSASQITEYTKEIDELQEQIKGVEREKYKLEEANDRYRRQLGGRYGADGKVQSQLEKLQKEYNTVLEENRNLKKQPRYMDHDCLSSISESSDEGSAGPYNRNNMSRTTISQLRREYEQTIESLNDEKRELVMRNSAATTDVQKAEQRAWEQEQEVSRLKGELTSLQLQLQRMEFARETRDVEPTPREKEQSFFSAHEGTPTIRENSPVRNSQHVPNASVSPNIERAMRQKAEREEALRSRFTSLTGSPCKSPSRSEFSRSLHNNILGPTHRHESEANQIYESPTDENENISPSKRSTDLLGLGSDAPTQYDNSMLGMMKVEESLQDLGGKPECQQS